MKDISDNSIDLIISSPPYLNLRKYSFWNSYEDYLEFITKVFSELSRIIKDGRYVCWNIQDNIPNIEKGNRNFYALMPDTIKIAQSFGFGWENNIVWEKRNASQLMFGSYPFPPTIIYKQTTESICIFRKQGKADLSNKKESDKLSKEDWIEYTKCIWDIMPELNRKKIGHPAPFPKEIPERLIKLHSFIGDTILDPFAGSGTTGVSCKNLNRNYILIEKDDTYCGIIKNRLSQTTLKEEGKVES